MRRTGVTSVFLLGVMAQFLEKEPPKADDRDHPLRTVGMVPLVNDVDAFMERFGLEVYSIYNMTELCCPVMTTVPMTVPGSAGRVRPGCELRVVDANDCEVPTGAVGEIVVRADTPWAINHGYYKEPEATARAWRNGWFHTGDAGRVDEDGNLYFVDRLKDTIRRRGENISSLEVETEVAAHPAVREAAVVPVPSELGEDEVMAVVALQPGQELDPASLLEFLEPRLAHFMIPALRPHRRRFAQDADREDREAQAAHRGHHRGQLGPRGRRRAHQARAAGQRPVSAPVPEAAPEPAHPRAPKRRRPARAATATRRARSCWTISIPGSACCSPSAHWGWRRLAVPPPGCSAHSRRSSPSTACVLCSGTGRGSA